jgi:TrmH family RNA methyltransferase
MLTKPEISRLRQLRDKKHRDELGLHAIEGEKVVGELLAAGYPLVEIYATTTWKAPASCAATVMAITTGEMERISHYPTPSNVFAVAKIVRKEASPTDLDQGLTLLLDGIQDAGNLGTLLRVADWFGFDRVVGARENVDVFNQKVINASMGSFSRVRYSTADLAALLAGTKTPVLGCDLDGEDIHTLQPLPAAIIAIGSEGRGLSPAVRSRVNRFVTIPRFGGAESLNAAIAAAIVCDNLRRVGFGHP